MSHHYRISVHDTVSRAGSNWELGHEDIRNTGPLKYKDVFDYLQDSVPVLMRNSHQKTAGVVASL